MVTKPDKVSTVQKMLGCIGGLVGTLDIQSLIIQSLSEKAKYIIRFDTINEEERKILR